MTYNCINQTGTVVNTHLYNYIERCQSHKPTLTHIDMDVTIGIGGSRVTSQVDFNENLAVKYYGITSNTISCDAL